MTGNPRLRLGLGVVTVVVAGLLTVPAAGEAPAVTATFDHGAHAAALDRAALGCTACHRVGVGEQPSAAAPAGVCHTCHVDGVARVRAPTACATCHPSVGPPVDHGYGWREVHGAASREQRCADCHRGSFCVDCHERREPVRFAVHDRAFLGIHGLEVRADPSACGSCHVEAFCVACHAAGPAGGAR